MRLELKKAIDDCYILNDNGENDLESLKDALDYLLQHNQNKKQTLILSDVSCVGKFTEEVYTEVAKIIKEKNVDRLIGVGIEISKMKGLFNIEKAFYDDVESLLKQLPSFRREMILVKNGSRFQSDKVVLRLEEKGHKTILRVNFNALHHNLNQYRSLLSDKTKLMVMVKANAYGNGILEVGNFLQKQQVDQLGVAYVDEAIELRNNGITIPIMIMNPHIERFSQFEQYGLQAEIFSVGHLKRLLEDTDKPPPIHIKIDTGMHRLGFSPDQIPALLSILKDNPQLKVEGIFTHFSSTDLESEDEYTHQQAAIFNKVYTEIENTIGYSPTKHALNSPGTVRFPEYHFDMVRVGIGLYGYDPSHKLDLQPVSQLETIISQIRELKKGATVGYSRKGKLTKDARIAVIPIGYEDGYLRVFGNGNAEVNVNGINCPTVGNICMDMTMIDVTDVECKEGDEVIIFGEKPNVFDLSKWVNTIPYEIMTNVSSRVKRVFVIG